MPPDGLGFFVWLMARACEFTGGGMRATAVADGDGESNLGVILDRRDASGFGVWKGLLSDYVTCL